MEQRNVERNVISGSFPVRNKFFVGSNYSSRSSTEGIERKARIVQDIEVFRQMTAKQIEALHFSDLTERGAKKACWETLSDLMRAKKIRRIAKSRMMAGYKKGSTGYVYIPRNSRADNAIPHTIDTAGLYVELVMASRSGSFVVTEYAPEKHAYTQVGPRLLKPDARLEIDHGGLSRKFHIEIDRTSMDKDNYRTKLSQYLEAWEHWTQATFPPVVFVVTHEDDRQRAITLKWIRQVIAELDEEDQKAFFAVPYDEAVAFLTTI